MSLPILSLIKAPTSDVFRRAYIKRRDAITGLYESDWFEITSDMIKFGKIRNQIDSVRLYKFSFSNLNFTVNNRRGRFNPETFESSYWYNFLNPQRTLFKIEAGFTKSTRDSHGIYSRSEYPGATLWDQALWDDGGALWDYNEDSTIFIGIIKGDIPYFDTNEITFNAAPLMSVFQDFPAKKLTFFTSTGMTASRFMEGLRDQQDAFGTYIFRQFFGDTTTNWEIDTTTNVYTNLNTSTSNEIFTKSAWDIIEKLAEAENYVPFITNDGKFKFKSRAVNSSALAFEFYGAGTFNTEYGHTMKNNSSYGKKVSKYYSAVEVKWKNEDTTSSYELIESSYFVSPSSNPYVLGEQKLSIENFFIPTSTVANTIAQNIFNDYSALKTEVEFSTSFIPQLNLFDRFSISYDSSEQNQNSLWDQNNWADSVTSSDLDLIWDNTVADPVSLDGQEFKFLSLEVDLDNLETKISAREI
jgi:hypothetical protein